MNFHPLSAAASLLLISIAAGSEDLYLKAARVDGLPLRLAELRIIRQEATAAKRYIDLSAVFEPQGIKLPEGGFIHYDTTSGWLTRRLDKHRHDAVDSLLENLFRADQATATCRAYVALLEPLSPPERLRMVMKIGFVPDPLLASFIDRIRQLKAVVVPNDDPFGEPVAPPKPLDAAELRRVKQLEQTVSAMLEISMQRLKSQLAVVDAMDPESAAPDRK